MKESEKQKHEKFLRLHEKNGGRVLWRTISSRAKWENHCVWKYHATVNKWGTPNLMYAAIWTYNVIVQVFPLWINYISRNQSTLQAGKTTAWKTTASLDQLTCTDNVDFGKCQNRVQNFFWLKNLDTFLRVNFYISNEDDNGDFLLVKKLLQWERLTPVTSWD